MKARERLKGNDMRKTKTIKIDDKEITVKELRVKDIRQLIEKAEDLDKGFDQIEGMLPLATNLSVKKLEDMAPSELKKVWEVFKEVNAVFFDLVAKTGIVKEIKSSILKDLTKVFADSLNQATERKTSSNTDSPSSPPPSKKQPEGKSKK